MEEPIITIARYNEGAQAHMDQSRLEAGGIEAMVAGEEGLATFGSVMPGSVELQVFERDAERALAILNDRIVTISRYDQGVRAHIDRCRLEAFGIPAMVAGENQPGLFVFHAVVGKSVELQVFERDAERALEMLREGDEGEGLADESSPREEDDGEATAGDGAPGEGEVVCPSCGGGELRKVGMGWVWTTAWVLLMLYASAIMVALGALALVVIIYLHYRTRRMRCEGCGRVFDYTERLPGEPGSRVARGRGETYW